MLSPVLLCHFVQGRGGCTVVVQFIRNTMLMYVFHITIVVAVVKPKKQLSNLFFFFRKQQCFMIISDFASRSRSCTVPTRAKAPNLLVSLSLNQLSNQLPHPSTHAICYFWHILTGQRRRSEPGVKPMTHLVCVLCPGNELDHFRANGGRLKPALGMYIEALWLHCLQRCK